MILVSGSSGFVGQALLPALKSEGLVPLKLRRGSSAHAGSDEVFWDPSNSHSLQISQPLEAVVHLAGENVFGLWTKEKKRKIYESRVRDTASLIEGLSRLPTLPKVIISASAVGYYGNQGNRPLDESDAPGEGLLADVCVEWEKASMGLVSKGVRTIQLRVGVVVDASGGILKKLTPIFKLGLGGPLGSGAHYMSWISLRDMVDVIIFCLKNENVQGPVNAVAPHPVTNLEFTRALGKAVRRPAFIPVPAPLLKLALKEFATEAMLSSQRVLPRKLEGAGFLFKNPTLEAFFTEPPWRS